MVLFIRILDPLIYFVVKRWGVPKDGVHPRWWCWLVDRSFEVWQDRHVWPQVFAADEAGHGLTWRIWPSTTTPQQIMEWYDDQIYQSSSSITSLNWFRVFLIRCTAEEAAHAQATGASLPADHLLLEWTGHRLTWWTEGRQQFQAAMTADHAGLYTVINSAATLMHDVLQPSTRSLSEPS